MEEIPMFPTSVEDCSLFPHRRLPQETSYKREVPKERGGGGLTFDKWVPYPQRLSWTIFPHAFTIFPKLGCRPNRPSKMRSGSRLPFMKGVVVDATEMGTITDLPNACAIIGGGVIAVEYANVLAGLGVGVSLLCKDEVKKIKTRRIFLFVRCCVAENVHSSSSFSR